MATIPAEAQKGFWLVIGVIAGLWVASLVTRRLP